VKLIGATEINEIRKKHTDLEIKVAKAIEECINTSCEHPMHQAIQQLLEEICNIPEPPAVKTDPLMAYLTAQSKNFAMFVSQAVQPTRADLNNLRQSPGRLTPAMCSDIIRLFGELAEQKDCQLPGSKWKQHEDLKEKLKPKPTFLKPEDVSDWRPDYNAEARRVGPQQLRKDVKQHIDDLKKDKDTSKLPEFIHARQDSGAGHRVREDIQKGKQKRSESPYVTIPPQIARGVDRFQLAEKSVVGILDKTFGLEVKGADVSGTTTDSIYALKYALQAPVCYEDLGLLMLLPIATMVQAGHHALLECAYPLSRWGYIQYQVGYYESLVPIKGKCGDNARGKVRTALSKLKDEADKLHVLVYRSGDQESGLLMEGQEEVSEFAPIATLLNAYGWCVTGPIDRKMVTNVLDRYSKKLLAKLPKGWDANVVESIFARRYAQERGLALE
jgi:hypothetical protein